MGKGHRVRRRRRQHEVVDGIADVAVIFVHGIGDQQVGVTLREGIECLRASSPGQSELHDGHPALTHSKTLTLVSEDQGDLRAICAEGWWNDVVLKYGGKAPSAWRVWGWTLSAVPWILSVSAGLAGASSIVKHSNAMDWADRRNLLGIMPGLVQTILWRFVLIPALLPLFAIAGTLVLVVETILGRTSHSRSVVARLSTYFIGDAWAFATQPILLTKILDSISETVATARLTARRVIIVGHSQGGALARHLCHADDTFADTLVTVGSGANLLELVRTARRWDIFHGWFLLLSYPIFISWIWSGGIERALLGAPAVPVILAAYWGLKMGVAPVDEAAGHAAMEQLLSWAFNPPQLVGVAVLVMSFLQYKRSQRRLQNQRISVPNTNWWDISSPFDPVCVGGIHLEDAWGVEVVNAGSVRKLWREHMTYFKNPLVGRTLWECIFDTAGREAPSTPGDARPNGISIRALLKFRYWGLLITAPLSFFVISWWLATIRNMS